jgi:hypothetical protein
MSQIGPMNKVQDKKPYFEREFGSDPNPIQQGSLPLVIKKILLQTNEFRVKFRHFKMNLDLNRMITNIYA